MAFAIFSGTAGMVSEIVTAEISSKLVIAATATLTVLAWILSLAL